MTDVPLVLAGKATVVLAVALGLRVLLVAASASVRALVMSAAFLTLGCLPVVGAALPRVPIPVPIPRSPVSDPVALPAIPADGSMVVLERSDTAATTPRSGAWAGGGHVVRGWSLTAVLLVLWLIGIVMAAMPLVATLVRTSRIRRRAVAWPLARTGLQPAGNGRFSHRVRFLMSDEVHVPMACGVWSPTVILPTEAADWPEPLVLNAVLHEVEHLRRRDWVVLVSARAACAMYWWHPLVWVAWRQLCVDAERACDDAVVRRTDSTVYAQQLVSLAKGLSGGTGPLMAMARQSDLRVRVAAVLDRTCARRALSSGMATVAVAIAVVASLALAPVQLVQAPPSPSANTDMPLQRRAAVGAPAGHFAGVVVDPTGVPVSGLLLIAEAMSCQARERENCGFGTWERTDRLGRFRFERLPVGRFHVTSPIDYFPGMEFSVSRDETTEQTITMTVLPLEQEFTICAECPAIVVPNSLAKEFAADAVATLDHPASAPRPPNGWEFYTPGTGLYPAALLKARVQGSVVLEGTIGVDGVPTGFRVTATADPRLSEAAMATLAAELWEPGRIRGTAVDVPFRFLIRYTINGRDDGQAAALASSDVRFDVGSVKRNTDPNAPLGMQPVTGGRIKAIGTVRTLMQVAYGAPGSLLDSQIVEGPGWAGLDRYEINAVMQGPISTTPGGAADRLLAMLRTLLEERFQLRVRRETRQLAVYDLVLDRADARLGPRLTRADGTCLKITDASGPITDFTRYCGLKRGLSGRGVGLEALALQLAHHQEVGRIVRNRTGLSGEFDFDIDDAGRGAQSGPSLFTTIREQLGLSLRASRGLEDVLVIEHLERPSPD